MICLAKAQKIAVLLTGDVAYSVLGTPVRRALPLSSNKVQMISGVSKPANPPRQASKEPKTVREPCYVSNELNVLDEISWEAGRVCRVRPWWKIQDPVRRCVFLCTRRNTFRNMGQNRRASWVWDM